MLVVLSLLLACHSPEPDVEPNDSETTADTTSEDSDTDTIPTTDTSADPCETELLAPQGRIWPEPGELFYAQIGLGGLSLGESALVVGPDGTRILVDVGNDSHDDDVSGALAAVTERMNQAGFTPRDPAAVEHLVITHLHADHADGLEDLLGDVAVDGQILHRGLLDITDAANEATVAQLCRSLALAPGASTPLCDGTEVPGCDPGVWSGTYPSSGCSGLGSSLALGAGADLEIVAINGHIEGTSFQAEVGPIRTDDLNGENARSAVGVLSHGAFRLLISGDLTAASSDSDAVEEFYADHILAAGDLDPGGVDVVHLAHHGRDSSNSLPWLDVLAPADAASRNAIIGISTAHLGSPHRAVLDNVLAGDRLADGMIWATTVAAGGATDPKLVDAAGGQILIGTHDGGRAYVVQAVDGAGTVLESRAFHAVGCHR